MISILGSGGLSVTAFLFRSHQQSVIAKRWSGIYALAVYHPVATLGRSLRTRSRTLRGRYERPTLLPQVDWSEIFPRHKILLTETDRRNGNVSIGELAILAQAAAGAPAGSELIEIGTFDGRTAMNLELNAPRSCSIFTLDLPQHQPTQFKLMDGERQYVDKPSPGSRFKRRQHRITQLIGDSATFDWSSHYGKAGLVFVDASHAYDYVRLDSATALKLAAPNGVVLWHDYGVWNGVTRALEDLERAEKTGLRHIRGTSLVVFTPSELHVPRAEDEWRHQIEWSSSRRLRASGRIDQHVIAVEPSR